MAVLKKSKKGQISLKTPKASNSSRSKSLERASKKSTARPFYVTSGELKIRIPEEKLGQVLAFIKGEGEPGLHDELLSTQEAADYLNVSRPFVVKLLDSNEIKNSIKVGNQRRVPKSDVLVYKQKMRQLQLDALSKLTEESEELGLDF